MRLRLLYEDENGRYRFKLFRRNDQPPYAILSHTWSTDPDAELTYDDVIDGRGTTKDGYRKVQFCADRAKIDGLRYFWVDTCCIDKSKDAELSAAINSMYQWYAQSVKCYVFLSDVLAEDDDQTTLKRGIYLSLSRSRWFTRGWTLQELLASPFVEFFSREGVCLGSKESLIGQIHSITRIPRDVLESGELGAYTKEQRLSWVNTRTTTEEEDMAYCMLGICGVSMAILYGEGWRLAHIRLLEAIAVHERGLVEARKRFTIPWDAEQLHVSTHFVVSPADMQFMENTLRPNDRLRERQPRRVLVLTGRAGTGKTQHALQFACLQRARYSVISFINGSSENSIKRGFVQLGTQIPQGQISSASQNVHPDDTADLNAAVREVLGWLAQPINTDWLLILDDVCLDSSKLKNYFPSPGHGTILVTSRSSCLADLGVCLDLDIKPRDVSLALIRRFHGCDPLSQNDDLLGLLQAHPLAIAQAGSHIESTSMTPSRFIDERESAIIIFDTLRIDYPVAANLLLLLSVLDGVELYYDLFEAATNACSSLSQTISKFLGLEIKDQQAWREAVRIVVQTGLLTEVSGSILYAHKLVRTWIWGQQTSMIKLTLAALNFGIIGWALGSDDSQTPGRSTSLHRLLPHALLSARLVYHISATWLSRMSIDDEEELSVRYRNDILIAAKWIGKLLEREHEHKEAEVVYVWALQGARAIDADHELVVVFSCILGAFYALQGEYIKAESMYRHVLGTRKRILGDMDPLTLETMDDLGNTLAKQDRLVEAESMFRCALQGREQTLGTDHASTLQSITSLAMFLTRRGCVAEAEQLLMHAIMVEGRQLGSEHPSVCDKLSKLADLYREQDKPAEAKEYYTRALQGFLHAIEPARRAAYGPILEINAGLGDVLAKLGRIEEARRYYEHALWGFEVLQGLDSAQCKLLREKLTALSNRAIVDSKVFAQGSQLSEKTA